MKTYNDVVFNYARSVCKKHGVNVDTILSPLAMYLNHRITDDEFLQVLQWIPEDPRVAIWKWYKVSNPVKV